MSSRTGACKADKHGFSARCIQGIMSRRSDDFGAEAVGDHQPFILRQDIVGKIGGDGEGEKIAIFQIVPPFVVRLEIGKSGFDLDDGEPALMVQRHDIGAPAVGERQLEKNGLIGSHQRAADPASDARCNFRTDFKDGISVRCHFRSPSPPTHGRIVKRR